LHQFYSNRHLTKGHATQHDIAGPLLTLLHWQTMVDFTFWISLTLRPKTRPKLNLSYKVLS